jgi:hypothetical protein
MFDVDKLEHFVLKAINPSVSEDARKDAALAACELLYKSGIITKDNIKKLKQAMPMLTLMMGKK